MVRGLIFNLHLNFETLSVISSSLLTSISVSSSLGSEDRRLEANDGERRPGCAPPAVGLSPSVPLGSSDEHRGGSALAPAPGEHHRHLPGGGRPPAQPSPHPNHFHL